MAATRDYFTGVLSKKSEDIQIAEDIRQKWATWYAAMAPIREKAAAYEDYYAGKALARASYAHPDTPNYFVPYTETIVNTIVAKFFLTFFAHNPIIRYQPINKESLLATRITERIMHYYLNHRTPDVLTNLQIFVTDTVLQGYGMLFLYWDRTAMASTSVEPSVTDDPMIEDIAKQLTVGAEVSAPEVAEGPADLTKTVTTESVQYEGFQFKPLDVRDIAADANELDQRKTPTIVQEFIQPEVYFERMESLGYPELDEEQLEKVIEMYDGSKAAENARTKDEDAVYDPKPRIRILHYYGKGYTGNGKDDVLQDVHIAILGKCIEKDIDPILERTALGYKPVIILRMQPSKQQFGGRGVGDETYDLQTEININFNSRILNTAMALHRMFIVSTDAKIKNLKSLISRPGGIIEVDGPIDGALKELPHAPLAPEAFQGIQETIQYMQSVTAAQDIVMGQTKRQELATTATILDNNSKQRLELLIYRMCKEAVSCIGDTARTMLLKAYSPEDKVMAILTKDEIAQYGPQLTFNGTKLVDENGFLEVQIKDLQGAMFADTEVSATEGDKRAERQEFLQLLQTILQLNPQGMPTGEMSEDRKSQMVEKLNITRAIKEIFRLQGRTDVSEFITRMLVPVQVPTPEPPRTSVAVSVNFADLAPSVQARVLTDAQLILPGDEAKVAAEQVGQDESGKTPATPAGQGDQPGVAAGAPPAQELDAKMNAADESMAAGE